MRKFKKIIPYIGYGIMLVLSMLITLYFINKYGIKSYLIHELVFHFDRVIPFVIGIIAIICLGIKTLFKRIFRKK